MKQFIILLICRFASVDPFIVYINRFRKKIYCGLKVFHTNRTLNSSSVPCLLHFYFTGPATRKYIMSYLGSIFGRILKAYVHVYSNIWSNLPFMVAERTVELCIQSLKSLSFRPWTSFWFSSSHSSCVEDSCNLIKNMAIISWCKRPSYH